MSENLGVEIERGEGARSCVVTVWLNRPEKHNAFDTTMLKEITRTFIELGMDHETRIIILSGRGKSFCSGADISKVIKDPGKLDEKANLQSARNLQKMFD